MSDHRDRYQARVVLDGVDNAVIARAQPKLRAPLQAHVRKIIQPSAHFTYASLNPALHLRRQTEEDGIKLAGVDLRGLVHSASGLVDAQTALAQVGLAALDARDKLGIKFGLVFEVIR